MGRPRSPRVIRVVGGGEAAEGELARLPGLPGGSSSEGGRTSAGEEPRQPWVSGVGGGNNAAVGEPGRCSEFPPSPGRGAALNPPPPRRVHTPEPRHHIHSPEPLPRVRTPEPLPL
eukprot:174125-Chlamydomonas_euryale.AAC.1